MICGFRDHDGIGNVALGESSPCHIHIPVERVYGDRGSLVDLLAFAQFDGFLPCVASVDRPDEHNLVMDRFLDVSEKRAVNKENEAI